MPISHYTLAEAFRELEYHDKTINMSMLKRRYHHLALKHHPDRGGNAAKMARINHAYKVALKWLQSEDD